MADIPFISQPIGAGNLHQVFNWLIAAINQQAAAGSDPETPPIRAFSPETGGGITVPTPPTPPTPEPPETKPGPEQPPTHEPPPSSQMPAPEPPKPPEREPPHSGRSDRERDRDRR
jgi:hypothetical protein